MKLGEVLADAIKLQRDRKNPEKQVWDIEDRMVDDVSDLAEFYKDKVVERIKTVQEGLESGKAQLEEDSKKGVMKVKMEGLKEEIFDAAEISSPVKEKLKSKGTKNPVNPEKPMPSHTAQPRVPQQKPEPTSTKGKSKVKQRDQENRSAAMAQEKDVEEDSIEDFFVVDDLICDELGEEKPKRPKTFPHSTPFNTPSSNSEPETSTQSQKNAEMSESERAGETGKVYEISTPPVSIGDNVKRSTVFSGFVENASTFMKDNFDYDMNKGGITPSANDNTSTSETTVVDAVSSAEQDAIEAMFADTETPPQSDDGDKESVQDVVQAALKKGVNAEQLKHLIDALPSSDGATAEEMPSDRPTFRRQRRRRI